MERISSYQSMKDSLGLLAKDENLLNDGPFWARAEMVSAVCWTVASADFAVAAERELIPVLKSARMLLFCVMWAFSIFCWFSRMRRIAGSIDDGGCCFGKLGVGGVGVVFGLFVDAGGLLFMRLIT